MIGNRYAWLRRIIRWQAMTIVDRKERRQWRNRRMEQMTNKLISDYKWGVSYSVFDGHELLEASIRAIRDHVDYINVVYQTKSWYGVPANSDLVPELKKLKKLGLIDELIEYKANPNIKAVKQECEKRNIGLRAARHAGVDYFMTMDTDEFYNGTEFESAKRKIIEQGITHSFCNIVGYGVMPTQQILAPTPSFVQFMSKIGHLSRLGKTRYDICLIDPTRRISRYSLFRNKCYFLSGIQMHHFSYVRKNVITKLKNSSAKTNHNVTVNDLIKIDTVMVPDTFDLMPLFNQFNKDK